MNDTVYCTCADTAKLVRTALKEAFPGIKFSVTSKTYSMGAHIDVRWQDGPTEAQVKELTAPYHGSYYSDEYGGDSIKMPRRDTVDPKTGKACDFGADGVDCQRQYTVDFYRPIAERVARKWGYTEPLDIKDRSWGAELVSNAYLEGPRDYLATLVWREIRDVSAIPVKIKRIKGVLTFEAAEREGVKGFYIGGDTWPNQRAIKEVGGKWIKERKAYWLPGEAIPESLAEISKTPEEVEQIHGERLAQKFNMLADNLQDDVDEKRRDRGWNPTYRRNQMDESRLADARHLEALQDKLRALAQGWLDGSIPTILKDITTKAQADRILTYERFYSHDCLNDCGLNSESAYLEARQALLALGNPDAGHKTQADEIADKERAISLSKIDGFFPTPETLVRRMIDLADIRAGMAVLEPSAGKGDIADAVPDSAALDVIEPVFDLREILTLKGYKLIDGCFDFLEYSGKEYDRIVMNPPFEHFQDIDHVQHAYTLLKAGGRLVAIMSESAFFRSDRKASEFREWLDSLDGIAYPLDAGTFLESDRPTGVNTRLVIIDKPEPRLIPAHESAPAEIIRPVQLPLLAAEPESAPTEAADPLETIALESARRGIKPEYFATMSHEDKVIEGLALALSHYFKWIGADILKVASLALEDANFHKEAAAIEAMIEE